MEANFLISDLKNIARSSRRLIKKRYTDVLRPNEKANLCSTCQEAIDALIELECRRLTIAKEYNNLD